MSPAEAASPYERQSDPQSSRSCGAACLSMVYRSLGKPVAQDKIWPAISKPNQFGSLASTTHLMVRDALNQGFAAIAVQARHPLQVLRLCREFGIRGIVNHRLQRDVPTGHYSVLVDVDERTVLLHDPFTGPSRRLSHAELLELWQPQAGKSEILGNVLIGIATEPPPAAPCQFCHTPMLPKIECPRCKQTVGLEPGALLGCLNNTCIARMWNYAGCPSCDYMWSFSLQPQEEGVPGSLTGAAASAAPSPAAQPSPTPEDPLDLNHVFGELDKFCAALLSIPAAQNHPDTIKILLDHGAKLEVKEKNGLTALMIAAAKGQPQAVSALLARGADRKAATEDGKSAADLAAAAGHPDVAKLLSP